MGRENADNIEMGRFLKHTNYPVYRIPVTAKAGKVGGMGGLEHVSETLLFDIEKDYSQLCPVNEEIKEKEMRLKLIKGMKEADSPDEQFERLGLL